MTEFYKIIKMYLKIQDIFTRPNEFYQTCQVVRRSFVKTENMCLHALTLVISVPIHVELCVIHAENLTFAHVLSTTHVHSRALFRTEKRYFHRTTLLGLLF